MSSRARSAQQARQGDADPQAIQEAGFDQRLTKPFSLAGILGPIETFFAHRA
jgi:hypothetical protein